MFSIQAYYNTNKAKNRAIVIAVLNTMNICY